MSVCSICLQHSEEEETTSLPCGHAFHADCLVPWLLKQGSCPNCRYTERKDDTQQDATVTDLRNIIEGINHQRAEQQRKFTRNVRLGKKKDAPKSLQKKILLYEKCKERMRITNETKKNLEINIQTIVKKIKKEQDVIYKKYLEEYRCLDKQARDSTHNNKLYLTKTRQKINIYKQRLDKLKYDIIDYQ